MFRLTAQKAYERVKRLHPDEMLWRCIDNGKEWGFMFNPIGVEEDMYGSSYIMIAKTGYKIYELPMIPNNLYKLKQAKQIPITLIIDKGAEK